jgi:hypothetical protein
MSLVEALHGRVAMAEVGTPWPAMGELAGEGREGEGKGRGVGATGGGGHGGRATRGTGAARPVAPLFSLHVAVREKKGGRRREEREKKIRRGGKKRKGKKGKNFQTCKFSERKIKDNL